MSTMHHERALPAETTYTQRLEANESVVLNDAVRKALVEDGVARVITETALRNPPARTGLDTANASLGHAEHALQQARSAGQDGDIIALHVQRKNAFVRLTQHFAGYVTPENGYTASSEPGIHAFLVEELKAADSARALLGLEGCYTTFQAFTDWLYDQQDMGDSDAMAFIWHVMEKVQILKIVDGDEGRGDGIWDYLNQLGVYIEQEGFYANERPWVEDGTVEQSDTYGQHLPGTDVAPWNYRETLTTTFDYFDLDFYVFLDRLSSEGPEWVAAMLAAEREYPLEIVHLAVLVDYTRDQMPGILANTDDPHERERYEDGMRGLESLLYFASLQCANGESIQQSGVDYIESSRLYAENLDELKVFMEKVWHREGPESPNYLALYAHYTRLTPVEAHNYGRPPDEAYEIVTLATPELLPDPGYYDETYGISEWRPLQVPEVFTNRELYGLPAPPIDATEVVTFERLAQGRQYPLNTPEGIGEMINILFTYFLHNGTPPASQVRAMGEVRAHYAADIRNLSLGSAAAGIPLDKLAATIQMMDTEADRNEQPLDELSLAVSMVLRVAEGEGLSPQQVVSLIDDLDTQAAEYVVSTQTLVDHIYTMAVRARQQGRPLSELIRVRYFRQAAFNARRDYETEAIAALEQGNRIAIEGGKHQ